MCAIFTMHWYATVKLRRPQSATSRYSCQLDPILNPPSCRDLCCLHIDLCICKLIQYACLFEYVCMSLVLCFPHIMVGLETQPPLTTALVTKSTESMLHEGRMCCLFMSNHSSTVIPNEFRKSYKAAQRKRGAK